MMKEWLIVNEEKFINFFLFRLMHITPKDTKWLLTQSRKSGVLKILFWRPLNLSEKSHDPQGIVQPST
jgi:hypothetical protein